MRAALEIAREWLARLWWTVFWRPKHPQQSKPPFAVRWKYARHRLNVDEF